MSASPWPHLDAARPQSIAEHLDGIAAKTRERSPEAVALGNSVGEALAQYLDGALTLRDLARLHTPYERFRAVRVFGPGDPRFAAIMPVLDELKALHKGQKSPQRPERVGKLDWTPVAVAGRYVCTQCDREVWLSEGAPQLCPQHRRGLALTGAGED